MHVPDGCLDAPTSVATGVMALSGVALALRGTRGELDDRTAPMAGLVATFVFAGQLMNFPVGLDPASRRELADILRSLDDRVLMVTFDLLTDPELMRRHRLELPFGFDPATIPGIGSLPA